MIQHLNLETGAFANVNPQAVRTLREVASIYRDKEASQGLNPETPIYEIHGCPAEVEGPPILLYATTVLYPGQVGNEFFMTRGHFHTKPERGEFMLTLKGKGALILMTRDRETWMEDMKEGSVHDIDGHHAHRVANTGSEPLVFLVTWLSDCGHDYESIKDQGFGKTLVAGPDGPLLA